MIWQYLGLLATHWVADFVCQTHWQASNKSKDNRALSAHVASYTAILGLYTLLVLGAIPNTVGWRWTPALFAFIVGNGALHFATDYCTSRISSRLYAKQDWHNFFVVIGFDQLIHQATLAVTLWLLVVHS